MPEEIPIKRIKKENIQEHNITENIETCSGMQSYTDVNNKSSDTLNSHTQIKAKKISQRTVATLNKSKCKNEANGKTTYKRNERVSSRYQNKLLQKLLSHSIQHERNLICQCMKYIVDNNFFYSS